MKFERTRVMNFEGAIHGMRNPMNSWNKSDSYFGLTSIACDDKDYRIADKWLENKQEDDLKDIATWIRKNGIINRYQDYIVEAVFIGPNDMELMQKLIRAGSEHRKFMRQIFVSVDITAPSYWWREFDTYKVGTTANSTSTMHKLASTPITIDCFETDDSEDLFEVDNDNHKLFEDYQNKNSNNYILYEGDDSNNMIISFVDYLEDLRKKYNVTKDKRYWKELVRWLPQSWLQIRTVTMNYENILTICKQREGHKLSEWQQFIDWASELPYANELLFLS